MRFVENWQQASREIGALLCDDRPTFLSRIGGSDTNAVAKYLSLKESKHLSPEHPALIWHKTRTAEYNGFYDRNDSPQTFLRYCEELLTCYEASEHLVMCNSPLLSIYFPTVISKEFLLTEIENRDELQTLITCIEQYSKKTYYFYQLIESIILNRWTLFRMFATALADKKVLVVSPFSESIRKNFPNRKVFFKNYDYPDFQLLTLDTPITYSGLPVELYPHSDWFETLRSLKAEIARIDFDIALLSCGSYAMPLGVYAQQTLQRKAVYVGGILQLYFGIMGRRYEGAFVAQQINAQNFIYPVERERYVKFAKLDPKAAKEAFGAYF